MSLFPNDKIVYVENLKELSRLLMELISVTRLQDTYKYAKVNGFTMHPNKQLELQIKEKYHLQSTKLSALVQI
jgi:hypothetical protein